LGGKLSSVQGKAGGWEQRKDKGRLEENREDIESGTYLPKNNEAKPVHQRKTNPQKKEKRSLWRKRQKLAAVPT